MKKAGKFLYEKVYPPAASMFASAALGKFLAMGTTNIMTIVLAVVFYPIVKRSMKIQGKSLTLAALLSATFFTAVYYFIRYDHLAHFDEMPIYSNTLYLVGFFFLFYPLLKVLYQRFRYTEINTMREEPKAGAKAAVFFGSMACMLLCWLPYFLMLYPGDITADSISELNQAVGNDALSNHHPIAHTAMIKLFFTIGKKLTGEDMGGVVCYSVMQAVTLSAAFSYLTVTLYKFRVKLVYIVCILLYFMLPSYHGQYSVTMWKDVWFAIVVLSFSVTFWRILVQKKAAPEKKLVFEYIMLYILGVGVCLFRSNGLYAYMFTFVFLLIYCIKTKKILMLGLSAAALATALIIKGPVYDSLGVTPPDPIESLSLPAQQIAAVVRDREITDEQRELLSHIVDVDRVPERYAADISDSIKELVRETNNQEYLTEHKSDYLKLWIDLGLKYPDVYLVAHINQTRGYWYPDIQYWVYPGEFRNDNLDLWKENFLSEEGTLRLQSVREAYRRYYFLGLFWSIGGMTWAAVYMFCSVFVNRRRAHLLVYLPVIGVILTLMIATPVYAEFRYAYSVFATIPLLCVIPFFNEDKFHARMKKGAVNVHAEMIPETEESTTSEENTDTTEAETSTDSEENDTIFDPIEAAIER